MSSVAPQSVTDLENRLSVAEGLLETLDDPTADPTLALGLARELLGIERDDELAVEEARKRVADAAGKLAAQKSEEDTLRQLAPEEEPDEDDGDDTDEGEEAPVKPKSKKKGMLASTETDESGRSNVAKAEFTASGFTDMANIGITPPGLRSGGLTESSSGGLTEAAPVTGFDGQVGGTGPKQGLTGFETQIGGPDVNAALGVGITHTTVPPNLRDADDWERCGNCVFFHKGCNLYGQNRPPLIVTGTGQYPVTFDQLCDSYQTLSEPAQRMFSSLDGAHHRMRVAEAADDHDALVRVQARVDVLTGRIEETWSDAARAAALAARKALHGGGSEHRLNRMGPDEHLKVGPVTHIQRHPTAGFQVVHHGRPISSHGGNAKEALEVAHETADREAQKVTARRARIAGLPQAGARGPRDPMLDPAYRARRAALIDKYGPPRHVMAAELTEVKSDVYPDLNRTNNPNANWVSKSGGLPRYIERIAKHLHYEKGKDISQAIAIAVNVVKKMCATGDTNFPGKQNVNAKSHAEACAAVAEWEAKKAKSHAKTAAKKVAEARDVRQAARDSEMLMLLPEETWELAQAITETWEPTPQFERIVRAVDRAYKPIPPSQNYIRVVHEEIALVEGSREWMVGMALVVEEAELDEISEAMKMPAGHLFVKATSYKGHKLHVTRKDNRHHVFVDGKHHAPKGFAGKRMAEAAGKMAIDAMPAAEAMRPFETAR